MYDSRNINCFIFNYLLLSIFYQNKITKSYSETLLREINFNGNERITIRCRSKRKPLLLCGTNRPVCVCAFLKTLERRSSFDPKTLGGP